MEIMKTETKIMKEIYVTKLRKEDMQPLDAKVQGSNLKNK